MAKKSQFFMKNKSKGFKIGIADQILEVCDGGVLEVCDKSDYSEACIAKMRKIPKLFIEQLVEAQSSEKEAESDQPIIELVVVETEEDIPVEQKAPGKKPAAKKKAAKKSPAKKASKKKAASKKKSAAKKSE